MTGFNQLDGKGEYTRRAGEPVSLALTRLVPCLFALLVLAGCSSLPKEPLPGPFRVPGATASAIDVTPEARAALYAQHREWAGTPYLYGGMDKSGVDCSGFVMTTFIQRFGLRLPRTTERQARVGQWVATEDLLAGDLVFFRTGFGKLHVGIYVEDGRFLHASSSRGVMLSRLDNPYWSSHYWKAQRVRP